MLKAFIEAHGGSDAFATALNVPSGTVKVWRHRGFVPRGRWPDLMQAFPDVTLDELMQLEAAKESPTAEAAA